MSDRYILDEDFVGAVVDGNNVYTRSGRWVFDGVGTETVTRAAPETDAPGILNLSTGASSGDTCRLIYGDDLATGNLILASQVEEFAIRFRVSNTGNVQVMAGLFDDDDPASAAVARYVFLSTDANINMFSASSESGTDLINSTIATSTTFRTFRARFNGAGNLAAYQILDENGGVLARGIHSAEIVTATPVRLVVQVQAMSAALRTCQIDRITLRSKEFTR
jgi:hypothetical protein